MVAASLGELRPDLLQEWPLGTSGLMASRDFKKLLQAQASF